ALLAWPAASLAEHRHADGGAAPRQLRGAMITPNWSIAGTLFARSAEQQRTEIHDVCSMGGDLIRLHVDWSQLQPGDYQTPPPPPAGPLPQLPLSTDPAPQAPAYDPGAQPATATHSALPPAYRS